MVLTVTRPEIILPFPHPGQRQVREQARRFNWLAAGRRWRKTTLAMSISVEAAVKGSKIIWGAPVYDQVRVGWDETRKAAQGIADFNISRMTASFPGGGSIIFRSLDNPDNVRGHTADGVVVDESADVQASAWYEVLRPMLIDTDGWAWLIGTPKGRDWFWTEHQRAQEVSDSMSWRAPTFGVEITAAGLVRSPHPLENPNVPFSELVKLYESMTEQRFRQEILAEFSESPGGVFRRVRDAATATPLTTGEKGRQYVYGVDWAKHNDFTVITVMDAVTRSMVAFDRFNQIDYQVQLGRLQALTERFKPAAVIPEANSIGEPLIEQLQRPPYRLPIQPFWTTNATKKEIIDGLALALERGDISIFNDPTLISELQAYEAERLPSGLLRYGAPSGMHDDTVMSLALALYGIDNYRNKKVYTW